MKKLFVETFVQGGNLFVVVSMTGINGEMWRMCVCGKCCLYRARPTYSVEAVTNYPIHTYYVVFL